MKKENKLLLLCLCLLLSTSIFFTNTKVSAEESLNEEVLRTTSTTEDAVQKIQSTWGTSKVVFDKSTGSLDVYAGTIANKRGGEYADDNNLVRKDQVKVISVLEHVFTPEDSSLLFASNWTNLEAITGELDTSKTSNMYGMFYLTKTIKTLNVTNWDTSNVTDMSWLFSQAGVSELDVSRWNTAKVTSMYQTFNGTGNLLELDLSRWNTSNVTNMSLMFGYSAIQKLNLGNFDTSKVTTMLGMFALTKSLKTIGNTGHWDTSNVTDMSWLFSQSGVSELEVSRWNTTKVTTMYEAFNGTGYLSELDLSRWDTSNVEEMSLMFSYSSIKELNLSNFNTEKATNMIGMFAEMVSLEKLNISNFNTKNLIDATSIFESDTVLSEITLGSETKFVSQETGLPLISTESGVYTGRWVKVEPDLPYSVYETSSTFMLGYNGELPGTYVWEKPKNSKVTIKYHDINGLSISDEIIKSGKVGESYLTEKKIITGYTFKEVVGNSGGIFSDKDQLVTYIYTKNPTLGGNVVIKYQDTKKI